MKTIHINLLINGLKIPSKYVNIKYIYENYVSPQNIFLVSSKKNIGFDNFKNSLYNEIFNIHTFLSTNKFTEQNISSINITDDNNDNNDNKSNYDYYKDKLKKNCSYL